jgi:hypothetical protein
MISHKRLVRRSGVPFRPPLEIVQPNHIFNPRLPHYHRNRRPSAAYVIDPVVLTEHLLALGDRFIKRRHGHFNRMLDPFQVGTGTRCGVGRATASKAFAILKKHLESSGFKTNALPKN